MSAKVTLSRGGRSLRYPNGSWAVHVSDGRGGVEGYEYDKLSAALWRVEAEAKLITKAEQRAEGES